MSGRILALALVFSLSPALHAGDVSGAFNAIRTQLRAHGVTRANPRPRLAEQLSTRRVHVSPAGELQTYIQVSRWSREDQAALRARHVRVDLSNLNLGIVQAWIPNEEIDRVASLSFVRNIRPPKYPVLRTGGTMTEGDAVVRGDILRASGFTGSHARVGVISDGVDNLAESVASGDLPSGITTHGTCTMPTTCNEGTAILEIIHDIAPGAALSFGAVGTDLEFIQRLDDLEADNCQIIIDDLGFYDEPVFEDGQIALAVKAKTDSGIIYVSSAGNDGESSYQADFNNNGGYHDFGVTAGETSDLGMKVFLPAGGWFDVYFQWNDKFGTGVVNDYTLEFRINGTPIPTPTPIPTTTTTPTPTPIENPLRIVTFPYNTTYPSVQHVEVRVKKLSGADRRIQLFFMGYGYPEEYVTPQGSIFGHPAIADVLAVGAIRYSTPTQIEYFSSLGPSLIYYDNTVAPSGTPTPFPTPTIRAKPDVAGIDGVSVSGAGEFHTPFYGTSAAAPHVAAVAALLYDPDISTDKIAIRNAIRQSAVDLGTAGFDNTYGYGRVDAGRAAAYLLGDQTNPDSTITSPTGDVTIAQHDSVTFEGSCTDATSTAHMTYDWSFSAGSGILASTAESPGAVTFAAVGTFPVTFTCTDQVGNVDPTPATVHVTVTGVGTPTPTPTPASSGGSSGGCAAGAKGSQLTFLALALVGLLLLRKRRLFSP
ncbi:MAG: S8 family serine peptidase [Pseudomonadota bacterium]